MSPREYWISSKGLWNTTSEKQLVTMTQGSTTRDRGGCLAILASVFIGSMMLVFNGAVVVATYHAFAEARPKSLGTPQVSQLVYFLAPVLMLVMEWWVIDLIADRTRRRRDR